ncbi:MAG: extracellular solute-binding protein, partial [Clostridia bacterium]|nr:extracellular solute-binding protein [Clostridia bacterium]
YGITSDGGLNRLDTIFNHAFGVTGTCVQEDGKWIFSKASKAEKEKLAFYASLYADGLLDPDFLTNTWDVMEQRWYDGTVAIVAGTAGGTVQVYDTKMVSLYGDAGALTILPPAKGVSQSYLSIDVTKEGRGFAINVDSANKDAAWAVLEFMASPEGRILDKVGVEGVQYTVENDKIVFTDKFAGWWARFWDTTYKFNPQNPSLEKWVLTDAAAKSLEMVSEYAVMDHNILIPDELTPQWDAMVNLYNEYASDIIRGVKTIDTFDEFVKQWNDAGGNDFADILQQAFAE